MDKLITIEEVANYLRIGKITLYRMAQQGKIPASKIAHQWRFKREEIDEWIKQNRNVKENP